MQETEIYSRLTQIFQATFDQADLRIRPETTARDVDEWDSFRQINLTLATEAEFGIRFSSAEIERLQSVGDFADLIQQKLQRR